MMQSVGTCKEQVKLVLAKQVSSRIYNMESKNFLLVILIRFEINMNTISEYGSIRINICRKKTYFVIH